MRTKHSFFTLSERKLGPILHASMAEGKRIRIVFRDDDILSDAQKSEGLNRSWLLLKPHHATVSDVASHLLNTFQLHQSCPQGLCLSISGYVLPSFESTSIFKDNEIVRVVKRRNVLSIEGNGDASGLAKLEAVRLQPVVNNGVLLLANEKFEKEKGCYESDGAEEDGDVLYDAGGPSGKDADGKKRRRKGPEKLPDSKKKKQRLEAPGDVVNDFHTWEVGTSSQGGACVKNKLLSHKEKQSDSNSKGTEENIEENAKTSEDSDSALLGVKQRVKAQENSKDTENAKVALADTKKVPSRSARRKHAKRKWLREMTKIQRENATCESEGLKNWKADHAKTGKNKDEKLNRPRKWKKQGADSERMEEDGQQKGMLHWKESHENTMSVKGRKRQRRLPVVSFHQLAYQEDDVAQAQPITSTETISKEAEAIVKEAIQEQMERLQNGKKPNENGDAREESNQYDSMHEQTDERNENSHEKPNQQNGGAQPPNENGDASEQSNKDGESEVVPIVIRPGHIRFEPLETDDAVQQNHLASETQDTFQWNGITSKKKGQKWGTEKYSFSSRSDSNISNKDQSELPCSKKQKQSVEEIDFEKLPPLPCGPKVGDLIAYRLLELSSCWTPELSEFRVGKVTSYNVKSNKTVLVPVPEYPIVSKTEEDEHAEQDNSLYKDDGSLEIDFSALIGVRILQDESAKQRSEPSTDVQESTSNWEKALTPVSSGCNPQQTLERVAGTGGGESDQGTLTLSAAGNGAVDPWDEISEALSAKKDELVKESSWGKPSSTVQVSQISSFGKSFCKKPKYVHQSPVRGQNSKNEQRSQQNGWGKNAQPSQENSLGKQAPSSKPWSYKALKSNGLGLTMSMLRSKNDA